MPILHILREGGKRISRVDAVVALVCGEVLFRLSVAKFTWDALDDVDGNNFCHDDMCVFEINGMEVFM